MEQKKKPLESRLKIPRAYGWTGGTGSEDHLLLQSDKWSSDPVPPVHYPYDNS